MPGLVLTSLPDRRSAGGHVLGRTWAGQARVSRPRGRSPWLKHREEDVVDGWDIRGRWFGVVVGATPQLGELRRGETITCRVIAAQIAPPERRGSR
jgi:hypothetical protein